MSEELLPADLVAEAKAMWNTTFWQRMLTYLRERREALQGFVDVPLTDREVWIRMGAVTELNRMLRGDAFLLDVIRGAQTRQTAEPDAEPAPSPSWMAGLARGDVLNG